MLTAEEVKTSLTDDDVIKLLTYLGSEEPLFDQSANAYRFTTVCHHGDSQKLYYYRDSHMFYCYTQCGSLDIFGVVQESLELGGFYEAFKYVVDFFGLQDSGFKDEDLSVVNDWNILQRAEDLSQEKESRSAAFLSENLLDYYEMAFPGEWLADNISEEALLKFGIKIDSATRKIIIPHRDDEGHLVGIRARSYDLMENDKAKYSPVTLNGVTYKFPTGQYLYGLWVNKEAIQRHKRVLICEGEKSVLQYSSYYPEDECICVATSGSNITQTQIALLLKYGVEEVVLGYDRDFEGFVGDEDVIRYENKLKKIIQPLLPYFKTYVIMDYDHITGYKCSCTDCGKEIYEQLYKKKRLAKFDGKNNIILRRIT